MHSIRASQAGRVRLDWPRALTLEPGAVPLPNKLVRFSPHRSGQFENSDGLSGTAPGSLPGGKTSSSARAEGVAGWRKISRSSSLPCGYRSSRRELGARNSSPVSAPAALARTALAVMKEGSLFVADDTGGLIGYPQRIWLRRMVASLDGLRGRKAARTNPGQGLPDQRTAFAAQLRW